MIDNGFGIVDSNDALKTLLQLDRSIPRLIDVLIRKVLKDRDPFANVSPVLVLSLEERDRRVHFPVLMEEGRGREPHPVCVVQCVICIEKVLIENISAALPTLPEVASSQEAGHKVPAQVVHPAFSPKLVHAGINCRIACLAHLPLLNDFLVL